MARKRKLKVYRTPIGFHDAYVAAPNQKEALKAWGSDADLFARAMAEVVTDPALIEEPMEKPGTVVKRLRGTPAEQIAALPKAKKGRSSAKSSRKAAAKSKPRKKTPPPSRNRLDAAEQALADTQRRHKTEERTLKKEEERLARERRHLHKRHRAEVGKLQRARDRAEQAYDAAVRKWRG
jgi:hypothetical protein